MVPRSTPTRKLSTLKTRNQVRSEGEQLSKVREKFAYKHVTIVSSGWKKECHYRRPFYSSG